MRRSIVLNLFVLLALLAFSAPPARADLCGALQYQLTNGQTADATQVMANFNALLSCINAIPAPNLLVNPSMEIDQANEGTSQNVGSSGGANAWVVDQWGFFGRTSSTGDTIQRVTDAPPGFTNSITFTVGTGAAVSANEQDNIYQNLEGNQVANLAFGTTSAVSVSYTVWVKSSITGSFAIQLGDYNFSNNTYSTLCTITVASTWTKCSGTIPGPTSGTWNLASGANGALTFSVMLSANGGSSCTLNTWQGSGIRSCAGQTNITTTTGGTFQMTGVKLEASPGPSPFVRRDFATELALAQRYYRKTFPIGTKPAQNAGVLGALCHTAPGAALTGNFWPFGSMRATPTITTYNPSAANTSFRDVTAGADKAVTVDPGAALNSSTGVLLKAAAANAAGDTLCIHVVADARL